MSRERRIYGYYPPVRRDPDIYRALDNTNKNLGRIGFCVGLLGAGGYFLYKKVKNLSAEVKKYKETGK